MSLLGTHFSPIISYSCNFLTSVVSVEVPPPKTGFSSLHILPVQFLEDISWNCFRGMRVPHTSTVLRVTLEEICFSSDSTVIPFRTHAQLLLKISPQGNSTTPQFLSFMHLNFQPTVCFVLCKLHLHIPGNDNDTGNFLQDFCLFCIKV